MELKPYQVEGRDYLASRRYALLADQMRLGKTAQAITAAQKVGARRILVICPAIAVTNWEWEFGKWWPFHSAHVDVISFDTARLTRDRCAGLKWDVLIIDESHYLKNVEAKRTQAILGRGGIAHSCHRVWALSGTPAPNHAGELWPLLYTFGATKLTHENFLRRFCRIDPLTNKIYGTKTSSIPELRGILNDIMLRRSRAKAAPQLPAYTVTPYYVTADPSYLDLAWPTGYDHLLSKAQASDVELHGILKNMTDDEALAYVNSSVDELATLRRVTSLLKAPKLVELLRFELDCAIIEKCVVFGYHVQAMLVCSQMLTHMGYSSSVLYGGTTKVRRQRMLRRFELDEHKPKGIKVLFAQVTAAGTAIDLSAAHEGIMLEQSWVPAVNAQAMERMGGYNQKHPIRIRSLILEDSVDEIVTGVVDRKTAELTQIFNEAKT